MCEGGEGEGAQHTLILMDIACKQISCNFSNSSLGGNNKRFLGVSGRHVLTLPQIKIIRNSAKPFMTFLIEIGQNLMKLSAAIKIYLICNFSPFNNFLIKCLKLFSWLHYLYFYENTNCAGDQSGQVQSSLFLVQLPPFSLAGMHTCSHWF